jgi:hypothetical protein
MSLSLSTPSATRLRALAALPLLAALSLSAGCDLVMAGGAREEATETITRSYPLTAGGTLDISTVNGRIEVTAGTKPTIEVTAIKVARAATKEGAEALLKKFALQEDVSANLVKLRVDRGSSNGPNLHGWRTSSEIRYKVQVPATTKLVLETTNGQIEVVNVAAGASLETVNGRISARGLGGQIEASTVNGGVDLGLASVTADVKVATTNGGVTVRLPSDAKALLSGRTVNGGLNVDGLQVDEIERSRRRFEGRLNGGGSRIQAETTNGGITFARAQS